MFLLILFLQTENATESVLVMDAFGDTFCFDEEDPNFDLNVLSFERGGTFDVDSGTLDLSDRVRGISRAEAISRSIIIGDIRALELKLCSLHCSRGRPSFGNCDCEIPDEPAPSPNSDNSVEPLMLQ